MKQKRWNIVVLLVVAALVAVSVIYIYPPGKKTHLGLDLQGGLEVVYKAQTATGKTPSSAQINQTIDIMNRRVNGLGVTESAVQRQGSDQISVALPGIKNAQQALKVIGEIAQLEFFDDANTRVVRPGRHPRRRHQASSAADQVQHPQGRLRQAGRSDGAAADRLRRPHGQAGRGGQEHEPTSSTRTRRP